ncbi:MAG: hypothetical protein V1712_03365 [Patescibacteria group bacterium]
MKKFTYVIVLFILLTAPTVSVFALNPFDPGGQYNPFYFKEVPTNASKESDLKSQYGVSAYNDCYRQSGAASKDTNDPSIMASYLSWIEYCLESHQIKTVVPPINTPPVTA